MSYVVAGWYTPDYARWVAPLKSDLERLRIAYDLVEVPPLAGGWETRTRHKAVQVLAAMNRHPDKTVIFVDVDCSIAARLGDLGNTGADVLVYGRPKHLRNGKTQLRVRSGTLVLRPTPGARDLVEAWIAENGCAQPWDTDQHTLARAMSNTLSCTYGRLPVAYCATEGDNCPGPVILHARASANERKIGKWGRALRKVYRALQWSAPVRGPAY